MDSDIEELESLFSEHFGRTPLNTPAGSQETDDVDFDDDTEEEEENNQRDLIQSVVDRRIRCLVDSQEMDGSVRDESRANLTGAYCGGEPLESEHSDDSNATENLDHIVEMRESESNDDLVRIGKFLQEGCGCKKICTKDLKTNTIYQHILNVREMEKEEKDMYMISSMMHGDRQGHTKRGKKRKRSRIAYLYNGVSVCRPAFMLSFDVGKHSLEALVSHVKKGNIAPRIHGNRGRTPSHALKYDDVKRVVEFIQNYADTFGLPQPAAPRGRDNIPPIYLGSETMKYKVHLDYVTSCDNGQVRAVKQSSFYEIWKNCLPFIRIASPRDDVCATCEKHRTKIMNAVEEQDKIEATTHFRRHVETAQKERQIYNECIKRAKEEHNESPTTRYNHYTFDFSQAVSIPHYSRQLGPIYFASLRKVQVFGVRIDGMPNQMNFLVDENETIGKDGKQTHGPNAVISMLDYILDTQGREERSISLHADNCPGQNKNRYVIGYFVWRVMTGRNSEVEYLMQVPGHARCLVDGGFGHVKKLYRRSNIETMDRLEQVVRSSAEHNDAVRYPAWQWRDWKSYMAQMFKPVPGIRKYQYFKTTIDEPGTIIMRTGNGEPDVRVNIVQRGANISDDLPPVIQPGGLTRQRQEYLYKTVRPYLLPENQHVTCPEPHD